MQEWRAVEPVQSFAYEISGNSAVILRCFSSDGKAWIPEALGGYPVTELAPYAFSAHMDEENLREALQSGRAKLYVPEALDAGRMERYVPEAPDTGQTEASRYRSLSGQALCGSRLEEIALSRTVQRVGRYCFYDCGSLHRIEFHGALSDWGSGAFTGCHHVRSLRVVTDSRGQSHLKDVLDELRETLLVEYFVRKDMGDEVQEAQLVFPEFYEEGVENTPARILETHVHGSGILYRNCFHERRLDFAQYDVLFPHAKVQESPELTARMVLSRLMFPCGLTRKAREQYEDYAGTHGKEIGLWLLDQRDLEGIRFLTDLLRHRACVLPAPQGGKAAGTVSDADRPGQPQAPQGGETAAPVSEARCDAVQTGKAGEYDAFLREMLRAASRLHAMEAVSFLMEQSRAGAGGRRAGRKRMEL